MANCKTDRRRRMNLQCKTHGTMNHDLIPLPSFPSFLALSAGRGGWGDFPGFDSSAAPCFIRAQEETFPVQEKKHRKSPRQPEWAAGQTGLVCPPGHHPQPSPLVPPSLPRSTCRTVQILFFKKSLFFYGTLNNSAMKIHAPRMDFSLLRCAIY